MKLQKYKMIKEWRRAMFNLLRMRFPQASGEEIDKFLDKMVRDTLQTENVQFHNNYTQDMRSSTTLDITEFYYKKKPITTEHGVMFDPDSYNPASMMLKKFKKNRNTFKAKLKIYDKASFEYKMSNLKQLLEKIKSNAFYGVAGAKTSVFYNLYSAISITGKGQTLISTATMAFEMFLSNSVVFRNNDECLVFIKNVVSEAGSRKYDDHIILDRFATVDMVYDKLKKTFMNKRVIRKDIIYPLLCNLSQENLNRLYYKNNIYAFSLNKTVKNAIKDVVTTAEVFNDPNNVPEYLKASLGHMWSLMEEYVFYNYPIFDRGYRLRTHRRKSVLVIDTDSNMLHLDPWYQFVMDKVLDEKDIKAKDETVLRHIILYSLAYNLSCMISRVLHKFMKHCNVPKEKRDALDMKNEYLFSRMLITDGKKNYASIIEFKEGKDMGGELDIKGLTINKSTTNRNAARVFKDIVENDVLKSKEIDISKILRKLNDFENEIIRSLKAGEQTYLKPSSVKDFSAYKDAFSQQPVLAMIMWNAAYPEKEIVPPDSFYIIKCLLTDEKKLEKIKDTEPEIYERLKIQVFQNPNKQISNKGVYVIALPRDESIPQWLLPFVDIGTIVNDTLSNMLPILESLGLETIHVGASDSHYSNIVSF